MLVQRGSRQRRFVYRARSALNYDDVTPLLDSALGPTWASVVRTGILVYDYSLVYAGCGVTSVQTAPPDGSVLVHTCSCAEL
jgi:hypothetical protein